MTENDVKKVLNKELKQHNEWTINLFIYFSNPK